MVNLNSNPDGESSGNSERFAVVNVGLTNINTRRAKLILEVVSPMVDHSLLVANIDTIYVAYVFTASRISLDSLRLLTTAATTIFFRLA